MIYSIYLFTKHLYCKQRKALDKKATIVALTQCLKLCKLKLTDIVLIVPKSFQEMKLA